MNRPLALPESAPFKEMERRIAENWMPPGHLFGLRLSNDTTDVTNDIVIAPGAGTSEVHVIDGAASTLPRDQIDLDLPVSIIKQIDVAWAPENYDPDGYSGGGRSGGRSSSSLTNTTWHTYIIGGGGNPCDVLCHDSAVASSVIAAMPSGYTAYRRLGSPVRASAAIIPFVQDGDDFNLKTPVLDENNTSVTDTASTLTLESVPNGIRVCAYISVNLSVSSSGLAAITFTDLSAADVAPATDTTAMGGPTVGVQAPAVTNLRAIGTARVWTNTSRQIRARAYTNATALGLSTLGWTDRRGRDS